MSKNMVERVARAIDEVCWPAESLSGEGLSMARARAAIEAIRPTPAEMEDIRRAVKASAICNPAADVSTLAVVALDKFFEIALKP